jgi:ATP-dependent RNA helicase MSS116
MSQSARTQTSEAFRAAEKALLFASDVVGRGMDYPDVDLVVQVGLPMNSEQYVHRVGRTGRAGKGGRAVMILAPEEMGFIRKNPQFPIEKTEL